LARGIEADDPAQTLVMKDRDAEDAFIALTNELNLYRPRRAGEIMNIVTATALPAARLRCSHAISVVGVS